jgi:hypothetical protein
MREEYEPALPAELARLEEQLAGMSPNAPHVDRDRLMFDAGAASAQPGRLGYIAEPSWLGGRFWHAATVTMTAATVVLAAMLLRQRDVDHELAAMPSSAEIAATTEAAEPAVGPSLLLPPDRIPPGYLGVRHVALTQGVGALDEKTSVSSGLNGDVRPPATSRELLEELLPKEAQSRS